MDSSQTERMLFPISFAITLVKSKPSAISMHDYIQRLRNGHGTELSETPGRDGDLGPTLVADTVEADTRRTSFVSQDLNHLLASTAGALSGDAGEAQKTASPVLTDTSPASLPQERQFLVHVLNAQSLVSAQPVNVSALSHSLCGVVTSAIDILRGEALQIRTNVLHPDDDENQCSDRSVRACSKAFRIVYQGLSVLHQTDETACAPVVHALVMMFAQVLNITFSISGTTATSDASKVSSHLAPPDEHPKSSTRWPDGIIGYESSEKAKSELEIHQATIMKLLPLLHDIVSQLKSEIQPQRIAFEGFLSVMYDRFGRSSAVGAFFEEGLDICMDIGNAAPSQLIECQISRATGASMLKLLATFHTLAHQFLLAHGSDVSQTLRMIELKEKLHRAMLKSLCAHHPGLSEILNAPLELQVPASVDLSSPPGRMPVMDEALQEMWIMVGMESLAK